MKKILLTIGLVAFTSASVLAQGYFVFQTTSRYVWDDWSTAAPKSSGNMNVAFLIGTGNSLVGETVAQSTATNNMNSVSSPTAAWTAILNDPNYHLATNSGTGLLAVGTVSTLGTASYNDGNPFTVLGTSGTGGSTSVYVIGWNNLYANPFLAAAAGSAVGWSLEFTYAYVAGPVPGPPGTPINFADAGMTQFGVGGTGAVIPEPTTLALAGLGAASLLVFRRRKQ